METTPEQDAAIHQSVSEVWEAWRTTQAPWTMLGTVAAALTAETFDREKFRIPAESNTFLGVLATAIERLRRSLSREQRVKLTEILTRRFTRGRGFRA